MTIRILWVLVAVLAGIAAWQYTVAHELALRKESEAVTFCVDRGGQATFRFNGGGFDLTGCTFSRGQEHP